MSNKLLEKIKQYALIVFMILSFIFISISFCISESIDNDIAIVHDVTDSMKSLYENDTRMMYYKKITDDDYLKTFSFFTRDIFVTAYIVNDEPADFDMTDSNCIYSEGDSNFLSKSPGPLFHLVTLDSIDDVGSYLCIILETSSFTKADFNVTINEGLKGEIILKAIGSELFDIVLSLAMIIFGLFIIAIHLIQKNNNLEQKFDLYIGMLSIMAAIWSACNLTFFQLYITNGITLHYLYYLSFYAMPIFLLLYFESFVNISCIKEVTILSVSVVSFIVLQVTNVANFGTTRLIFLIMCCVFLMTMTYKMMKSQTFKTKSKATIGAFIFMMVCIIGNIVWYFVNQPAKPVFTVAKFGFVVYVIMILYTAVEKIVANMVRARESNKVYDIAYTDALTRVSNRYAFDRDVNTVNLEYICLISCDVNNLKYYNDTLGHAVGDELLKASVKLLQNVYGNSVYRTGGDEFIILAAMMSNDELKYKHDKFVKDMRAYNARHGDKLIVEVAIGYSKYQDGDTTYEDILRRADKNMYADKKLLKSQSVIKYER